MLPGLHGVMTSWSNNRRTRAVVPATTQGSTTSRRDLFPVMDVACDQIEQRLTQDSLNRHALLDLASALTIVVELLHRADQEPHGYPSGRDTLSSGRAVDRLDECIRAVRRNRTSAPNAVIREYVEDGLCHARTALDILRRREGL